jgi:hypothetical protein
MADLLPLAGSADGDKSATTQATWGLSTSREDACSLVSGWGSSLGYCSAARSVSWHLVLLGNRQRGVGHHRRTTLAATTTSGDLACSGSRLVASAWLNPPGAVQRLKTALATTSVFWLVGGGFVQGEAT